MKTSFLSIANMSGIACASSNNMTIFQLSKEEPVVLAVYPESPIPWMQIIESYKRKGEPRHHDDFTGYIVDFSKHLENFPIEEAWKKMDGNECKLIFMGYGVKDIYPSVYEGWVELDETANRLILGNSETKMISHHNKAMWSCIGDFDCVNTLFHGTSDAMKIFVDNKIQKVIEEYKKRITLKFAGTKYENRVNEHLEKLENAHLSSLIIEKADQIIHHKLEVGLDSFSIGELVNAIETMINANIRLTQLKTGEKNLLGHTKEIAVITRAEGLTWIKHCLFAI